MNGKGPEIMSGHQGAADVCVFETMTSAEQAVRKSQQHPLMAEELARKNDADSKPSTSTATTTPTVKTTAAATYGDDMNDAEELPVSPLAQWREERRRENAARKLNIKTEDQIQGLRYRGSRHLNGRAREELVEYYKLQNDMLTTFDEVDQLLLSEALGSSADVGAANGSDDDERLLANALYSERRARIMMRASYAMNVLLLGVKIVAYVFSGSISILASALDSFLDIVSGSVLFFTSLRTKNADKYNYPIGNNRMQPLGIIVFSSIMGTVGFQVLVEAMRQIFGESHTHHLEDLALIVGIMVGVMVVKLILWIFCRSSKDPSVQTYAQDHINDVFTNSVGLAGALLGDGVLWWLDPLFACFLSLYIVRCWTLTCIENFRAMLGLSAPASYIQKLTYLCCHFHPKIIKVDTVRAYTFGRQLFVEVDIVLPPDMVLRESHDIGESLQLQLERLEEVERAFVHIDHETHHHPDNEHGYTTRLHIH